MRGPTRPGSYHEGVPFEYEEIRAKTQQTLVDFLNAEIALGVTFTRSAVNAYDGRRAEHFSEAKDRVMKTAKTVRRFVVQVADGKIRENIERRLAELERLIEAL